jgi:hypothetical protein
MDEVKVTADRPLAPGAACARFLPVPFTPRISGCGRVGMGLTKGASWGYTDIAWLVCGRVSKRTYHSHGPRRQ